MTTLTRSNVAVLASALLLLGNSAGQSSEPAAQTVVASTDEAALKDAFAEFDRAYVPALALTNFEKLAASHQAYAKLLPAFERLKTEIGEKFPDDPRWQADFKLIGNYLQEAGDKLHANELKAAHESLEQIRATLMKARQRHNLEYYLDGMTRFHDTMESIVKPSVAALKKGKHLTEARRAGLLKLIAQARRRWKMVEAQQLNRERFKFNEERVRQLNVHMQDEFEALESAEAAARSGDSTAALQAMVAIKAPFARAFMLFGDFPGGKPPSPHADNSSDKAEDQARAANTDDGPQPVQGRGYRWRGGRGPGHAGGRGRGQGSGQGQGWGRGRAIGDDAAFQKDRNIFHFLLTHRESIDRQVKNLKDGVETLTESDDPKVASVIRDHVESMHERVKNGSPIHMRDPLFAAVFGNAEKISMKVERTEKGVRVTETSTDPYVVKLIQAHAEVVNLFVANGQAEVRRNHAVPKR